MKRFLPAALLTVILITGCGISIPINIEDSATFTITEDNVSEDTKKHDKEVNESLVFKQMGIATDRSSSLLSLFENKFIGVLDNIAYCEYGSTLGTNPVYFVLSNDQIYGMYDFGDDFVSIGYKYYGNDVIARVHIKDDLFNADEYVRDEFQDLFDVTDPEVDTFVIEDNSSDGLKICTYSDNNAGVTYAVYINTDDSTDIMYTTILLINTLSKEDAVSICNIFDNWYLIIQNDETYLSCNYSAVISSGVYTVREYNDQYDPTDRTITYKFPDRFITLDYHAKNMGLCNEIGIFKMDYGILVITPRAYDFNTIDNEGFTYSSFTRVHDKPTGWNNIDTDYRNGYICSVSYDGNDEDAMKWAYVDSYTYHLSKNQTDYAYISKDYPIVVMLQPINDNSISVDEFKGLVDEILDAGITVKEVQ